jgi:hypothetical protein
MDTSLAIDIAGWVGVAALLVAYFMVSTQRMAGNSIPYQLLNAGGGGLLILNSYYYGAFPSVGINIAWIGIAIYTLLRAVPARSRKHEA